MKRLTIVAGLLAAFMVGIAAFATAATKDKPAPGEVTVQFLAVSDWHGQLDPLNGIGGAAAIASYWDQDRALNPNTVALTAGDAYGATPPISNFFEEVPAVQALRMMGISVDTFGNHNFDRGTGHLQKMIDVASAPEGVQPGTPFRYLVANLSNLDENLSGVDKWGWLKVAGLKIAVIGAINEEAPTLVKPGSFGTMVPTDAPKRSTSGQRRHATRAPTSSSSSRTRESAGSTPPASRSASSSISRTRWRASTSSSAITPTSSTRARTTACSSSRPAARA
jgi:2',3'-cyclic-nucleotide 2'-phosphodiesterase (5'-nucleotidase family)